MKIRASTKVTLSAIAMSWTCLTAQQCGDNVDGPPTVQGCTVTYDSNFPPGGAISLDKPAHCPVHLIGATDIPYAATADFPAGANIVYGFYQSDITTWNGYSAGLVDNPVWSQGNGSYFVNISGDYYAAQGGFDPNNAGYDDIRNGFSRAIGSGTWTYGTTRVTYTFGNPSNDLSASGDVAPYTSYSVSTTTNDPLLISPVTWSWYVDGQLAGTTSDPVFTATSGDPLTQQQVQVVGSDGTGHTVSGNITVQVTAGCGTQLIC